MLYLKNTPTIMDCYTLYYLKKIVSYFESVISKISEIY